MKKRSIHWFVLGLGLVNFGAWPLCHGSHHSLNLFNGKDLSGWEGNPSLWSVKEGVLVGETRAEKPIPGNTFLIWKGGTVANFDLTLKLKITGDNNSGIQYRSRIVDPAQFVVGGYQADVHANPPYGGMLYEEKGRGIVAQRGQRATFLPSGEKVVEGEPAKSPDFDVTQWNEYRILARGNHLIHQVNGKTTVDIIDHDEAKRAMEGVLALQLHAGKAMKVEVKDIVLKPLGDNTLQQPASEAQAPEAKDLEVAKGFKVERLYSVPKDQEGSWVSLTEDGQGRLITSDQYGNLYRIDVPDVGDDIRRAHVEKLPLSVGHAHGLLWAFDSLYVMVNGQGIDGNGSGLYRVIDSDGDGELDQVRLLRKLDGGGEHGPHAVILSPDKKSLFVTAGNHTKMTEFSSSRVPPIWDEDHLLPQQPDARGHARGIRAPGGWICKVDPDGQNWEVFSIGFRNEYDIAFNQDGELFTYDSDMEWDMGSPWYRPTRVLHATSGSEFGWRTGTGKWPAYYPDSLPTTLDIGPGSPTGVVFGTGAKFPARYQRALYILDWTFGTIYAVHLTPKGASYQATKEEFVTGKPLPVTDITVSQDGALYFAVGGRRTQSGLYRVTYTGSESTSPAEPLCDGEAMEARALRHKLEDLHIAKDAAKIPFIWENLGHSDRHIRYAARVALENQDISAWSGKVFEEANPVARIEAAIALARRGDSALKSRLLKSLIRLDFGKLDESTQLASLRAMGLVMIRMGKPDLASAEEVSNYLDAVYPHESDWVNRELVQLLVALERPSVIGKTLALMDSAKPPARPEWETVLSRNTGYGGTILKMIENQPNLQKMHYALVLRNMRYGWTLEERERYFKWFDEGKTGSGGASYQGFLDNIKKDALANTPDAQRVALAKITGEGDVQAADTIPTDLPVAKGPGRAWTLDQLLDLTQTRMKGRDFGNGKNMFQAAICVTCHRFDGVGGAAGPDLTSVGSRFSTRDLLESILEPSKVISDQYQANIITKKDGSVLVGRIAYEENGKLMVSQNPLQASDLTEVDRKDIKTMEVSPISLMPPGLMYMLNENEALDLLAYLLSAGNPKHRYFQAE